jgi:hypothetical protein
VPFVVSESVSGLWRQPYQTIRACPLGIETRLPTLIAPGLFFAQFFSLAMFVGSS